MNFRYRLIQFMSGRYGADYLSYWLFGTAVALSFVNLFLRSVILQLLVYAVFLYALFRMLSRNTAARRRENEFFKRKMDFFKNHRELYLRQKNDKCHVYKKCPKCKAVLRLPHRIGRHSTVCPRCGNEFTVKVKK